GMAWVDSNYDGRLSAIDPVWSELKVWRDRDQDGAQDADEVQGLDALGVTELNYAMGTYTDDGQRKQLASPDLEADREGTRVTVVNEGILIQASENGHLSLLVTRIDDKTAVEPNRDGVTGIEDVEIIVNGADLTANDLLGGIAGRPMVVTGLTGLRHGTGFVDVNGFVHFLPEADYDGEDAGFDYVAQAENGQQGNGTVDVTLKGVNDAPRLAGTLQESRPVYGHTEGVFKALDENGYGFYTTAGRPIYQPYGIRYDFDGNNELVKTLVLNPEPGQYNVAYYNEPIATEYTGKVWMQGMDADDPASSLRYAIVSQPQYGAVSLNADGSFQYTTWHEPGVPGERLVVEGNYAGIRGGTLYYPGYMPEQGIYPASDVFRVSVTDPHGASSIASVTVPHYGPYLPPMPDLVRGGSTPVAVDLDGDGFEFT
ncbi:Ig-like domain-containing protein, partial [Lacisediminimonas profundi]|uniref:Ig-like domain-containing protein n=1 Tax=Lacisediminimonas profundi TaxID=2603856 RepID=UPI001386F395